MASNDLETEKLGDGFSGTGGRADDLELPISHQPRSSEADFNENGLKLFPPSAMILHVGAGSSSGGADELMRPISEPRSEEANVTGKGPATSLAPIREETQDGYDGQGTHQPARDTEIREHIVTIPEPDHIVTIPEPDHIITIPEPDHIITIPEPDHIITIPEPDHICRACGPDEEIADTDNQLVQLGCHCKGSLSMMHRKCILEWYGPRIAEQHEYKCEVCNALLHGRVERAVFRALFGQDTGTDILIKVLGLAEPVRSPRNQQFNSVGTTPAAPLPWEPIPREQPEPPRRFSCVGCVLHAVFYMLFALLGFGIASGGRF